jgi:protein O-mannosyl-transferase
MRASVLLTFAALGSIAYFASLHNPLIYDDRTLVDNAWLAKDAGPVSVFRHDYWHGTKHEASDLYRPLTVLSLAGNLRVAPSREAFRIVNLVFHIGAVLAVFWFFETIATRRAAWIGAALFAVHPLGSEAVLWTVARAETAAATLGCVAFVLFVKRKPSWLAALAVFGALCFKESAVVWLLAGAVWVALDPSKERGSLKSDLMRAIPHVIALAIFLVLRGAAVGWARLPVPFVDNPLAGAGAATRAVNAVLLFADYVWRMVWPAKLSVEYGFDQLPVLPILPWAGLAAAAFALLVLGVVVVLHRRGQRTAAFLVAFIPCAFAVTGNLVFPIGTIFAERLAYTPLIGCCGLAGLAIGAIPKPVVVHAVVAGLLVAGIWRTSVRCTDYKDAATLSEATAAASPRAVKALVNAARTRMRQGRAAEAIPLLERAVAIWPDYVRARELLDQARAGGSGAEER